MTLRVRCGGVDELVATVEELDEILDDIEQGANSPVLVSLHGSGGVLHVGLGAGESSVALFLDADHQPLAAHGASVQAVDSPTFVNGGRTYDFEPSAIIASTDARQAVREFLASGERPMTLAWRSEPAR